VSDPVEIHTLEVVAVTPIHVGGERGIKPAAVDLKVFRRIELRGGRIVERPVIPGSTLKGVLRHTFEDFLRSFVAERLGFEELFRTIGGSLAVAAAAYGYIVGDADVCDDVKRYLLGEQQILTEEAVERLRAFREEKPGSGGDACNKSGQGQQEAKAVFDEAIEKIREGFRRKLEELRNFGGLIKDGEDKRRWDLLISNLSNCAEGIAEAAALEVSAVYPFVCDPTATALNDLPDTAFVDVGRDRGVTFRLLLAAALVRKLPLVMEVCPACMLFGAPGRLSPLLFGDLELESESEVLPVVTRVSIDRDLRAAKHGRLFTVEYVPPGSRFRGEIRVLKPLLSGPIREEYWNIVNLLLKSLAFTPVGGLRSVGMGLIKVELLDGKSFASSDDYNKLVERFRETLIGLYRRVKEEYCAEVRGVKRGVSNFERIAEKLGSLGVERDYVDRLREATKFIVDHQCEVLEKLLKPGEAGRVGRG